MRQILFRGKTLDGRWVCGDLWQRPYAENGVTIVSFMEDTGTTGGLEVIPETVGQYTGLKDKNGQRIFEGDIVAFLGIRWDGPDGDRVDYVGIVRYSDEHTSFNFEISNGLQATTFEADDVKVIGNIHDNPELMGEMK